MDCFSILFPYLKNSNVENQRSTLFLVFAVMVNFVSKIDIDTDL